MYKPSLPQAVWPRKLQNLFAPWFLNLHNWCADTPYFKMFRWEFIHKEFRIGFLLLLQLLQISVFKLTTNFEHKMHPKA